MVLKSLVTAATFCVATIALAQPAPTPAQSALALAIQQSAMGMTACVTGGIEGLPASVTPEAGSETVLAACSTQLGALAQAIEALIATMPAEQQATLRTQTQNEIAQARAQIAQAIRQQRGAAAGAPAQ